MDRLEFTSRLDERLQTDEYADVDASANGLQVGPETGAVEHVAFAVDAAVETIEHAAERDADVLVTHHGISWGGIERVTGIDYQRIGTLLENDLALYVSHLPLDGHQELGNAAGIADLLGLDERAPFGTHKGKYVGQRGTLPESASPQELAETLAAELETGDQNVQVLDFGPEAIRDVAIVTGSGVDWLEEASESGADVLVTGEGKQHAYHEARERKLNLVLAGHYATETFGVNALADLVESWGLETTYIECPTGL